ncbi:hypothetical protein V499_08434 [Pseudogymnoascus sp. VKM F-103]|nr:hypothetical protein V499_08434 [Pseudogymnoascus sp. VKM F-103]
MDPVSLAGLGLGAASIAFQIFEGIKTGYGIFEDAADMPEQCESLRLRLRLECTRLLDWGDLSGLSEPQNHSRFDRKLKTNRATIMALLSEIKMLIDKLQKISLRSDGVLLPDSDIAAVQGTAIAKELHLANSQEDLKGVDIEQFRGILGPMEDQLYNQKRSLLTRSLRRVVDIGQGIADVAKQPGRIRWALSDKEAFQTHVRRLKELTDYLHETLGDHQMGILIEQTKETCMAMLQMTSSISEMKELIEAVEIATSHASIESETRAWLPLGDSVDRQASVSESVSTIAIPERRETLFTQLTEFRYHVASLQIGLPQNSEVTGLKLQGGELDNLKFDHTRATGNGRTPATYLGAVAWVEWKAYRITRHKDEHGKFYYGPTPLAIANLERLAAILHIDKRPTQLRVPLCAGYFDDEINQRFGLIYQVPYATPQSPETMSLSQLLLQRGSLPSLQSRISLAKELVTSLYFLHAVNWLHKGLRDESILVLTQNGSPDYSQPFISGFEYSRPDETDLTTTAAPDTWAVYAHPDYQGFDKKTYRKTFDIYSLGIILLEIALWKPAEEILGFGQPSVSTGEKDKSPEAKDEFQGKKGYSKDSLQDLKNIRNRLLVDEPSLLEQVRATMGSRYYNAVRSCICGLEYFNLPTEADETSPVIATLLQQAYLRLVVDVLRSIRV